MPFVREIVRAVEAELVEVGGLWVSPSIPALFQRRAQEWPHDVTAFQRDPREGGPWRGVTLASTARRVRDLALGLASLGVGRGDRVGLVAETRPEWSLVDLAILHLGAVTVGVYPTLTAEDTAYPLAHAGVEVVFVEDAAQLEKLERVRAQLAGLRAVVVIDPVRAAATAGGTPLGAAGDGGDGPLALAELEAWGARAAAEEGGAARFEAGWRAVRPDDLATIIYTSGTTGPPKGALLSHGNLTYTVSAAASILPHTPADRSVVFLPMAHALQRVASYGGIHARTRGYFTASRDTLMADIREVEPTVQVSVPRLWEKLYARLHEVVAAAPAHRQRIFAWGLEVGRQAAAHRKEGRALPLALRLRHEVARRVVHEPLRERVFGRHVRYLTSGGAPIDVGVLEYFYALGILILEGWGLTETAAPVTLNLPDAFRFGSVGRAIPGTEVRVAPDGELLVRGPGVFHGYYEDPAATAAAFDADGYFRTGDIGRVDADGFVFLTDRKKDLIVLSNGKKVPPQRVENLLKTIPLVGDALVHGERRSYLVALLTLDPEVALPWAVARGLLPAEAAAAGGEAGGEAARPHLERLSADPALRRALDEAVAERNAQLSRFEQLKRWRLLPDVWTVEDGALTPTLKLRRRVLEARYAEVLAGLYAQD